MQIIKENLEKIYNDIESISKKKNLDKNNIKLIAVTKNFPVETIQHAIDAGQKIFGENYIQEALPKINYFKDKNLTWHFIGRLQKNKIKNLILYFDLIHSVDDFSQIEELEKRSKNINKKINVLIQVNITREETKSGIDKSALFELLDKSEKFNFVNILGLMTIPPLYDDPEKSRPIYQELNFLLEKIKEKDYKNFVAFELSMGMSNDYKIALSEGATMIRIGSSIFGERKT
jgi:pyridoxal phosphate enzyme (YggS family)